MRKFVQWSAWRTSQRLIFASAIAALLGMTWLAFDLTSRAATTGGAIAALAELQYAHAQAAQKDRASLVQANAQERQAFNRFRGELDDDLRQLRFVVGGAMAGNVLLLLFALFGYRLNIGSAPAAVQRQEQAGAGARPALLEDMSRLLQSASDDADAYQIVQRCAAGLFAGCSGALYLAPEPGGRFEIKAEWGQSAGSSSSFEPADCWAIRRGEAYLAAGPSDIACRHMHQAVPAPSLCMPVMGQGAVLGVLLLEDPSRSGVLASMRAAARNFAGQIGLALANMKLRETLRNLSVRDPLTGLFNRRYMEESLNRELSAARRKSRPLAIAICDLNQFKRFNADFGSDAGNYALREIAQLIIKHTRSSDIASRYGKDEIVLVFPEAPLEGVLMRANQLREAIFALDLEHFGRQLDKISASFGVALFPQHGKTGAELLQQAEAALAAAKVFGNNRVQLAGAGTLQG